LQQIILKSIHKRRQYVPFGGHGCCTTHISTSTGSAHFAACAMLCAASHVLKEDMQATTIPVKLTYKSGTTVSRI
jgi:hypothetical protein